MIQRFFKDFKQILTVYHISNIILCVAYYFSRTLTPICHVMYGANARCVIGQREYEIFLLLAVVIYVKNRKAGKIQISFLHCYFLHVNVCFFCSVFSPLLVECVPVRKNSQLRHVLLVGSEIGYCLWCDRHRHDRSVSRTRIFGSRSSYLLQRPAFARNEWLDILKFFRQLMSIMKSQIF